MTARFSWNQQGTRGHRPNVSKIEMANWLKGAATCAGANRPRRKPVPRPFPSFSRRGGRDHQANIAKPPCSGADGDERSECKRDSAQPV